jgi:hypothetical protein
MNFLKRRFPIIIVLLTGVLIMIAYYVPHTPFSDFWDGASKWYQIIAGFTMVLGVVSLVRNHYRKIREGKQGFGYSIAMFVIMMATVAFGVLPTEISPIFGNRSGSVFMWIFEYINTAASATVYSLLAFYIASASYRAFRVRSLDATIMLVTALVVMVGRVPYGEIFSNYLTDHIGKGLAFLRLDNLTSFLLNYPTVATRRAITLGLGLATVSTSLRIILGIEKTYMGGDN